MDYSAPYGVLPFFCLPFLRLFRSFFPAGSRERELKLKLELRRRAFLTEIYCSTPIAPIPVENCLATCELSPIVMVRSESPSGYQWNPTPSDSEGSTFLEDWEKILEEMNQNPFARMNQNY